MPKDNPQYKDVNKTIALDFDGVIHKNSKGYNDGTVYDKPIKGTKESLKLLSKKYKLIIYSVKSRPDRKFPDNNTGSMNIHQWLVKYNLDKYISEITIYKPPAKYYIDDKGIRFTDWKNILSLISVMDNR